MNIFRLLGDLSHLASFVFLIMRLRERRSAAGISLKTQELYLLVFLTRYVDLFTNFVSPYNTVMKIIYIAASAWVVYLIRYVDPWKKSYDDQRKDDSFLHVKFAIIPCAVLAVICNEGNFGHWHGIFHHIFEVLWAFSIYLEAIAIAPQLILLQRWRCVENITGLYMASLGAYRALYILNWIYRWYTEPHYVAWIPWIAGVVQTVAYADFFYYFIKARSAGQKTFALPA